MKTGADCTFHRPEPIYPDDVNLEDIVGPPFTPRRSHRRTLAAHPVDPAAAALLDRLERE